MKAARVTVFVVGMLGAGAFTAVAKPRRAQDGLGSWQLAGTTCLQRGDVVQLRLNDGVTIRVVAKLEVSHIDRDGIVTFREEESGR